MEAVTGKEEEEERIMSDGACEHGAKRELLSCGPIPNMKPYEVNLRGYT